jgi:conflict system STAND superfamily ATPase/SIR2-like protein
MSDLVDNLASLMKHEGDKFVLMLGAGASITSGALPTRRIQEELLGQLGSNVDGASIEDRFSTMWGRLSDDFRRDKLQPYLNLNPSAGYAQLANLVSKGFFDLIVTFNYDLLVEKSLEALDCRYHRLVRGEARDEAMETVLEQREPRVKLVKPHGSFESADYFLFDAGEMLRYPEPLETLIRKISRRNIIVCGYGFEDDCVIRAFSEQGGLVVCVNPAGAPRRLKAIQRGRRSEDWSIRSGFDTFFADLHRALLEAPPALEAPKVNPFKFLESYETEDASAFRGREYETGRFLSALAKKPQVITIPGPRRVGKTSLVKAGLLPALDEATHLGVYIRCKKDLEQSTASELYREGLCNKGCDLPTALDQTMQYAAGRQVVLFLDHFDRILLRQELQSERALTDYLSTSLFAARRTGLTFALVLLDEGSLLSTLYEQLNTLEIPSDSVRCSQFDRDAVKSIIGTLAQEADIQFDAEIVDDLTERYGARGSTFGLAHVQAVCHMLAGASRVSRKAYEQAFQDTALALDSAINVHQIISFVEDFEWKDAAWLRNMIKVPLKQSRDKIAEFMLDHYQELIPPDERAGSRGTGRPRRTVPV